MTITNNPYRPTQKEIRRQCTLIRMAWAPREYWERAGLAAIKQWALPAPPAPRPGVEASKN